MNNEEALPHRIKGYIYVSINTKRLRIEKEIADGGILKEPELEGWMVGCFG